MSQGKQLTYEQKQAIVDVKRYMEAEKTQGKTVSTQGPTRRTAQALNLSISTVKQVLAEVQKHPGRLVGCEPKARAHALPTVSDHEIAIVRRLIQRCGLTRGDGHPSQVAPVVGATSDR
jgi:hypothetical protein